MVELAPGTRVAITNPGESRVTLGGWPGTQIPQSLLPPGLGGGGDVDSVNGQTGVVVLDADDVGAQPSDSDLTAIAALTTTAYGRAFLALANQAALMALIQSASSTVQGKVELATDAEATAVASTTLAVTPANLSAVLLAYSVLLTGNQTVAGVKTFSSAPVVPDASFTIAKTNGLQAALDAKISTLSYANALAGSRYTILYNGSAWPGSRPSARTDIYFDLIGGNSGVADPAWMLNGDAREIVS